MASMAPGVFNKRFHNWGIFQVCFLEIVQSMMSVCDAKKSKIVVLKYTFCTRAHPTKPVLIRNPNVNHIAVELCSLRKCLEVSLLSSP